MPAGHLPVLLSPGTSYDDVWLQHSHDKAKLVPVLSLERRSEIEKKVLHKPGHFPVEMEVRKVSNHSNIDTGSHNCTGSHHNIDIYHHSSSSGGAGGRGEV